jgi:hypothetical protein
MCAVLFVLLVVAHSEGAPQAHAVDTTPATCDGKTADFHAHRAKALIKKAYSSLRILDASPAQSQEKKAWREHRRCLRSIDRRKRISAFVDRKQDAFARLFVNLITPPGAATLAARRACENSGSYASDGGGLYDGAYQFDWSSWNATGPEFKRLTGIEQNSDRIAVPREQDIRASIWQQMHGGDAWPNCP